MVNDEEIKRDVLVHRLYGGLIEIKSVVLQLNSLKLCSDSVSDLESALDFLRNSIIKIETF